MNPQKSSIPQTFIRRDKYHEAAFGSLTQENCLLAAGRPQRTQTGGRVPAAISEHLRGTVAIRAGMKQNKSQEGGWASVPSRIWTFMKKVRNPVTFKKKCSRHQRCLASFCSVKNARWFGGLLSGPSFSRSEEFPWQSISWKAAHREI